MPSCKRLVPHLQISLGLLPYTKSKQYLYQHTNGVGDICVEGDIRVHVGVCILYCFAAKDSVASWLKTTKDDVEVLLRIACDEAKLNEAQQSLLSIQQAAVERWPAVAVLYGKLQTLAATFAAERQVCC